MHYPPNHDPRARRLSIMRGFDPDMPTEDYLGCFSLDEAFRSLRETTMSRPVTVELRDHYRGSREPVYRVVIDVAKPVFVDHFGEGDPPNWHFEGWIPAGSRVKAGRVRIYVQVAPGSDTTGDFFTFQWISDDDMPPPSVKRRT